jgi:hypothetical protein
LSRFEFPGHSIGMMDSAIPWENVHQPARGEQGAWWPFCSSLNTFFELMLWKPQPADSDWLTRELEEVLLDLNGEDWLPSELPRPEALPELTSDANGVHTWKTWLIERRMDAKHIFAIVLPSLERHLDLRVKEAHRVRTVINNVDGYLITARSAGFLLTAGADPLEKDLGVAQTLLKTAEAQLTICRDRRLFNARNKARRAYDCSEAGELEVPRGHHARELRQWSDSVRWTLNGAVIDVNETIEALRLCSNLLEESNRLAGVTLATAMLQVLAP